MSIGQEVSVTALQMLAAFAAIGNEGRLMQPHVIHGFLDADGREVRRIQPQAVRQVISPETAETLTEILTAVVAKGTGHKAVIEGYPVAGKTGTAQKLDPVTRGYSRKPGVLSFIGFVPSRAPRLAILALLDEPKTVVWGSEAAAPIFAAVASQALRHLDIPPTIGEPPLQIVRGVSSEPPAVAARVADEPGVGSASRRRDAPDRAPLPQPGLMTDRDPEESVMPELVGRSLRQALVLLAGRDIDVSVSGRGLVVRQSPLAGTSLPPGAFCRLELAPLGAVARPR